MAKTVQLLGMVTMKAGDHGTGVPVTDYTVGASSGPLGSIIHGLRIELRFHGDTEITLNLGAADALQLAEEIRGAVHGREDIRR